MAVFARGKITDSSNTNKILPPLLLNDKEEVAIPAAALTEKYFSISAMGITETGEKVTTGWVSFPIEEGAVSDGMADNELVQTVYENILEEFNNYYTKEEIDNIAFNGEVVNSISFAGEAFVKDNNSFVLSREQALKALGLSEQDELASQNYVAAQLADFVLDGGEL